ncbi:MAG: carbohydrate binding family 9 domain-containing protein [Bacteroidales bacterium]|nr:carbohydrate binding family 9 domain-containing protein [Bacteroidales bacterium]MBN2758072.1 carbohydrate binding family 9 domain-containing protein [Bacteroidales bacterium]
MKKLILLLLFFNNFSFLFSQDVKKSINISRTNDIPKIDGVLDDKCWENAEVAKDFIQLRPDNGKPSTFQSEVKFVYDDKAIYVAAMLYDPYPDSIMTQYSPRDEIDISDYFGVYFDPFNSGLNALGFFVTPVNIQIDMKADESGNEDTNWSAVWKSATKINEKGWVVEYKIPYSALRFPKSDIQTWGVNIFRNIQRYRENASWNFIDSEAQGWINQEGQLIGIQNVSPPLRLSFSPYVSGYIENDDANGNWTNFYKGGLDLKYGINESFTLDMMLVPDFGQVQSDDGVLNLSPFEVFYDEKRQFFTEGTELFSRASIFYSRRIGASPNKFYDVEAELSENETIIENPSETQLINATKISGRTNNGLGIGFLNGMTINSIAKVKDTISGAEREIITQPFTNYNVIVFDQTFKNNSYISLINTNLSRFADNYSANVTGAELSLFNNKKSFRIYSEGAVSQIFEDSLDANFGYRSYISFSKQSGQFRFSISNNIESDTYNPNDLGYLQSNNEVSYYSWIAYNFYKPVWRLLNMYNTLDLYYSKLYNPDEYSQILTSFNSNMTFKNHLTLGWYLEFELFEKHDYFESRVDGRMFIKPTNNNLNIWFSTDYRKKFAFDISFATETKNQYGRQLFKIGFEPRYRFSDRFLVVLETEIESLNKDIGYVDNNENQDSIFFGRRNVITIENTINTRYIFNENISINLRLRHYWSAVDYNKFFTLNKSGLLDDDNSYTENNDINFNFFTVDLSFRWIFAPGSELSAVWKNSINTENEQIDNNYFNNLNKTFDSPQINSFSIKVLYYLDYLYLKKKV